MNYKLVLLSAACFAMLMRPATSSPANIRNIGAAVINIVGDVASIGTDVVQTKAASVVRGATDFGSILATGLGLEIRALTQAFGGVTGGAADGFIKIGETIKKAGDTLVGGKVESSLDSGITRVLVETPVVQQVVEKVQVKTPVVVEEDVAPCEEEVAVKSIPAGSVQLRIREQPVRVVESTARLPIVGGPSVLGLLKGAIRSKFGGVASIFGIGDNNSARSPVVYEIIEPRRFYPGPVVEAFQVKK